MSEFVSRGPAAIATILLSFVLLLLAAYSKSVDSATDAVRTSSDSGHSSDAADLMGDIENAIAFYQIVLTEPSLESSFDYQRISVMAREKGLEKLANQASHRAAVIRAFEARFNAGRVSDAEALVWLRPFLQSEDLCSQFEANYYLADLRLTQKRYVEAVELAERAFTAKRKEFIAGPPSQESASKLILDYKLLGDIILNANGSARALPVLQEGLQLAKKYPVEERTASPSDPHHFRLAIAKAKGLSCDDVFNSRFDSALDDLVIDGPYSSVLLYRLSDQYVECIKEEAEFFMTRNRPDLAVKIYEREIPKMLTKMPDPDPFRGEAFAYYHAMLMKAQVGDPSNKSVPVCNTCQTNLNVSPDFPGGCVILQIYHWRCHSCDNTI